MENHFYQPFDTARRENSGRGPGDDYRTPFQIDRDRIIHNSAFRRLQNKTQVFFAGEYDFYRTRLTHSIEVAQIGRSLCHRLKRESPHLSDGFFIDPDLVEAACLAHDIGHPPFGHTGERSLHRLMTPYGGFEGNAQTLRILTRDILRAGRGMNPTRALVDGVLKYKTLFGEVADQKNHFLYTNQADWLEFVTEGRPFPPALSPGRERNQFRSIECQVMDWADDTAYSINDVADGVEAGFITPGRLEKWAENHDVTASGGSVITELIDAIRKDRIEWLTGTKIGEFIGAASLEEREGFLSPETNRHRFRLVVDPVIDEVCRLYKGISVGLVFRSRQLQQLDRKSDLVLTRLFEALAATYVAEGSESYRQFRLLSESEEDAIDRAEEENERARIICDGIARMTDGVASRTYRRLFDADFGSIVDLV